MGLFCRGVSFIQALHKPPKKETPWGSGVSYDRSHCDRLSSLKLSGHPPKALVVPRTTQLSALFLWEGSGSSRKWKKNAKIVDFWPFFQNNFSSKPVQTLPRKTSLSEHVVRGGKCDGARFKNVVV